MVSPELFMSRALIEKLALLITTATHSICHSTRSTDFPWKKFNEPCFSHNDIRILEQMHIFTAFDFLAVSSVDSTENCMCDVEAPNFIMVIMFFSSFETKNSMWH
ncbi:unnamed protein product [Phytomonas sp. Hart1]|nr:unnamed protein product [Phytomonas sp. Hart1]|eukprot:CCW67268.1 unnamed protein product [Phytomonas sp. isolate Hart1]